MNLEEAKVTAQKGIKITHTSFTDKEYLIMRGNQIVFENGVKIFFNEWIKNKDYLKEGWSKFKQ